MKGREWLIAIQLVSGIYTLLFEKMILLLVRSTQFSFMYFLLERFLTNSSKDMDTVIRLKSSLFKFPNLKTRHLPLHMWN